MAECNDLIKQAITGFWNDVGAMCDSQPTDCAKFQELAATPQGIVALLVQTEKAWPECKSYAVKNPYYQQFMTGQICGAQALWDCWESKVGEVGANPPAIPGEYAAIENVIPEATDNVCSNAFLRATLGLQDVCTEEQRRDPSLVVNQDDIRWNAFLNVLNLVQTGVYAFSDGFKISLVCKDAAGANQTNADLAKPAEPVAGAMAQEWCVYPTDALVNAGFAKLQIDIAATGTVDLAKWMQDLATQTNKSTGDIQVALAAYGMGDKHKVAVTGPTLSQDVLNVGLTGIEGGKTQKEREAGTRDPFAPGIYEGITLPSDHPIRTDPLITNIAEPCSDELMRKAWRLAIVTTEELNLAGLTDQEKTEKCRQLETIQAYIARLYADLNGKKLTITGRMITDAWHREAAEAIPNKLQCQKTMERLQLAEQKLLSICHIQEGRAVPDGKTVSAGTTATGASGAAADTANPLAGTKPPPLGTTNAAGQYVPAEAEAKRAELANTLAQAFVDYAYNTSNKANEGNEPCGNIIGQWLSTINQAINNIDVTGMSIAQVEAAAQAKAAELYPLAVDALLTVDCFPCKGEKTIVLDPTLQDRTVWCPPPLPTTNASRMIVAHRQPGRITEIQFQSVVVGGIPELRDQIENIKAGLIQQARAEIANRCGLDERLPQFQDKLAQVSALVDSELDACLTSVMGEQAENLEQVRFALDQCAQSSLTLALDEALTDCKGA